MAGQSLTVAASASDPDAGDVLTFALDVALAGMTIDPSSGLIQWTPGTSQVGTHPVAVRVTDDGGLSDSESFMVTVDGVPNSAPVADAGPNQSVTLGATVQLDGSASSDPDGDVLTYLWTLNFPTGSSAALSDATSATPSFVVDRDGTYTATLTVNDGELTSAADSVTITATFSGENAPSITSAPVTQGSVGSPYVYDVQAVDPDPGDTLTYTLLRAPVGMGIDAASGLIQWSPSAAGAADVDVQVTDSTGRSDRQIYLVRVNNGAGDQPPTLAPINDQNIDAGQTLMVTAVGADPEGEPVRYSLPGAPPGMIINTSTGELAWTPMSSGSAMATVAVADPGGQQASTSFSITVGAQFSNSAPTLEAVADRTVAPLTPVQISLSATDPDDGDILTFSLSGLPGGAQFDGVNFNWIPGSADAGTSDLIATVTDSVGNTDSTTFAITVTEPPYPPVAVDDAYTIDRDLLLQVPADGVLTNDTDANDDPLIAAVTSLPVLGTLDSFPSDGSFTYTPPANPNILIGLEEQCRSPAGDGISIRPMPIIGDVDADGDAEVVSYIGGFTNRLYIMDGNCNVEANIGLGVATHGVFANQTQPALVNLDSDPELEILVVRTGPPQLGINRARLVALNPDGSLVWTHLTNGASEAISGDVPSSSVNYYQGRGPTIVDLDGDGSPEILMSLIFDNTSQLGHLSMVIAYNADGTVRWEYTGVRQIGDSDVKPIQIADLDLDGTVEIINHTNVIDHNGQLEFILQTDQGANFFPTHLTAGIANFDNDPFPELIARDADNLYLFQHNGGAPTWTLPMPNSSRAEITVAELDGDPMPEFVFHTGFGTGSNGSWLSAFDSDGSILWTHQGTIYDGPATTADNGPGVTAFDFDRDGIDELVMVVYTNGAGSNLFIFDGRDGAELAAFNAGTNNAYSGLGMTFPSVVDVDGDGAAEVVYVDGYGIGYSPFVVLNGLAGQPFPPARPIRHQANYQPTQVNGDGSTPTYQRPHWLIPGLNKYHAMPVLPFEDPGATDSYTYLANDGDADSNEATVRIAITNVNAPTIVSTPALGASPGFDYQYGLLATDGDFGDQFTWTLVDAPAGMTVSVFGIIDWTPVDSDMGPNRVQVVVTDLQGNSDEQTFSIDVRPPVSVPDVVGGSAVDATAALTSAGLAVGNVAQTFSFTVPAGEVVSQSISGGAESAAGGIVDFVVSLGPPPIFVPNLVGLTQPIAAATLADLTLNLGTISRLNDDVIPAGVILSQSVSVNSQVATGSSVDLVVSGGPVLKMTLASNLVGNEETLPFSLSFFDINGSPTAAPGDLAVSVVPTDSSQGSMPVLAGGVIIPGVDTRGAYALRVAVPSLGLVKAETFMVEPVFAASGAQGAYGALSAQVNRLQTLFEQMTTALLANDLPAVSVLGASLQAERAQLDLEELALTPAAAPEMGFLPEFGPDAPSSFDRVLPGLLEGARAQLLETAVFLDGLDPGRARNDDLRNRSLTDALAVDIAQFLPDSVTRNGTVGRSGELYRLLSVAMPALVRAEMDALLRALGDAGLLAGRQNASQFYQQVVSLDQDQSEVRRERPAFFTLVGMSSASSIRMQLIKDLYVPIIKKIGFNLQNLAADGLLRANFDVATLPGIVTAASLSFHQFAAGNSIMESTTASPVAGVNQILLIGPTLLADVQGALSELSVSFTSFDQIRDSFRNIRDTASAAQDAISSNLALLTPDESVNGCVFTSANCRQLGFSGGFPTVYTEGTFPAPVLMLQYNAASGAISSQNFLFFSRPSED
ncbi:MAG: PASTA domain-containing protein [Pseudomonadales bacterium]|nr:PASTA domain-containing protein [Pseudomonadales bacterium]